jgi:hypothetical protein
MLGRMNWYAVAAVLFTVAMFVALADGGVPDHYSVPLGLAAVVSAVLSLRD